MVAALLGVRCVSTSDLSTPTASDGGGGDGASDAGPVPDDAADDTTYHGNGEIVVTANGVQSMAASADALYWSNFAPKAIRSIPFAAPTTPPATVATPLKGASIAYGQRLYWSEVDAVGFTTASGQSTVTIQYGTAWVAADDQGAYAIQLGGDVFSVDGDPPTGTTKLVPGANAKRLAVRHGVVAWTDASDAIHFCSTLVECDMGGKLVASEPAHGLALDDARVYWSTADGRIRARVRDLSADAFDVATGLPTPAELVLDPTSENLYFTAYGTGERSFQDGVVGKVPKTGGSVVLLAHDQARPDTLALSATDVYWANTLDASIRRLPK
jgi:hypothetical protein